MPDDRPPAFLLDTLATMAFGRRAGEWDLQLEDGPPASVARVVDYLERFRSSFPWASFARIALGVDGREAHWSDSDGPLLDDFLAPLEDRAEPCSGLETELDLRLHWVDSDGLVGDSVMPRAGRIVYDHETFTLTLTVWPNLFTDQVYVYSERDAGVYDRHLAPFTGAASLNRRRLAHSLTVFAASLPADIEHWESELVDAIEPYGFPETAEPR